MKKCAALVLFLALSAASFGANITVDAIKADTPPVIDGKLDDAVWQTGDWHTGFHRLDTPEVMAEVQTHFKIAADGRAVYVAVRLDEPAVEKLGKTQTRRDSFVYHDDSVEFMLGADPSGEWYVHVITNAIGTLYDGEVFDTGRQWNRRWNGDITVASTIEKTAWNTEMRIPLTDMRINGKTSNTWIFSVARERSIGKVEASTFSPCVASFLLPDYFASLRIPAIDLSGLRWVVEPSSKFTFELAEGALTCSSQARIQNQTGQARSFLLRPKWSMDGQGQEVAGADVPAKLADGEERLIAFSFPVPKEGKGNVIVEVRDSEKPDTLWAIRSVSTELKHIPLAVQILEPCYRNSIYATQTVRTIRAMARVALGSAKTANAQLLATLAPVDKRQKHLAEVTSNVSGPEVALTLPIAELETGSYVLAVTLQSGQETIAQSDTVIRKLAPVAHEWRFDENNVLLHNGKPVLPFGWYCPEIEVMTAPDCPFTVAQSYDTPYYTVEKVRKMLDEYAAVGKPIAIPPYPTVQMEYGPAWGQLLSDKDADAIRERVRSLKDHPGLLAWYMADEPENHFALQERVRRLYEVVSQEDPYHPCIMLNNSLNGVHLYNDGGDILLTDPYPQFLKNGFASIPIEKVSTFVRTCQEASGGRKPAWLCPQFFNYSDYMTSNVANNRAPTFTEMRNMVYQGVASGAKGFLCYIQWASLHYMSLQVGMPFLAREAADLKDAILASEATDALKVDAPLPKHMYTSVRHVGDHLYVFAVNTATTAQEVKFTLANATKDLARLVVVSEDRTLTVGSNAAFSDRFGAYETHIYTSDSSLSKRETIAAVQAEVAKRDAARKKPGNLAFEDYGTQVSASTPVLKVRTAFSRLFDGVLVGRGWFTNAPRKTPEWIEVVWPQPITVGRIVVVTETAEKVAVLAPQGDNWKELSEVSETKAPQITLTFSPTTTDRFRIEVRKNRPDQGESLVTEIEAYAE